MLGLGFILLDIPYRKLVFKIKNLGVFYFFSFLILFAIFAVQNWNYSSLDFYYFKDHLDIFLYFFPTYLIVYLLYRINRQNIIANLLDAIVLVSLLQAIISLIFFFIPSTFDIYTSLLSKNASQGLTNRLGQIEKRLIGVGSAFFTGVVKYSIAFFILIIIPYLKTNLYKNKLLYVLSFIFIIVAGLMTGRTFFIAIGLGLVLYLLIDLKNALKLIYKVVPSVFIFSALIYFILISVGNQERVERVFNFVFELYINYQESGQLTSSSTEGTLSMYKFPDSLKTWIIGDGRMEMPDGSYYMHSDVGYVRMIFYFGIILTVLYMFYQGYMFYLLSKKSQLRIFKAFYLILFLWLLVLNFKGLANLNQYLLLFFIAFGVSNEVAKRQNKLSTRFI
ncbi:hypothetical protein ABXT08_05985 [Chryseobacterium sp. NRRL B-14859]|uniref:hypothetical protein n=1 Tax=Chryseobacterium sp. NRRL B-14859 TaxID=1562763 RepID=UPI003396E1FA